MEGVERSPRYQRLRRIQLPRTGRRSHETHPAQQTTHCRRHCQISQQSLAGRYRQLGSGKDPLTTSPTHHTSVGGTPPPYFFGQSLVEIRLRSGPRSGSGPEWLRLEPPPRRHSADFPPPSIINAASRGESAPKRVE